MHLAIIMQIDNLCTARNALKYAVIVNIGKTNVFSRLVK